MLLASLRVKKWRIIGSTETGPQPYNTGGEVAIWKSVNKGKTWTKENVAEYAVMDRDGKINTHIFIIYSVIKELHQCAPELSSGRTNMHL